MMWNTKPRQVERISEEADEQTVVAVKPQPANADPSDDEKSVRAVALLLAIGLTVLLLLWRNPESPLWWLLACLALSSWCCALGSFITDILKVAIEWIVEAFAYLRTLLASWRDGAKLFTDKWIWSRFRANQTGGEDYAKHV